MQGSESAAPSQCMESPEDEERDAVDAVWDYGVYGTELVFTLRAGLNLA